MLLARGRVMRAKLVALARRVEVVGVKVGFRVGGELERVAGADGNLGVCAGVFDDA